MHYTCSHNLPIVVNESEIMQSIMLTGNSSWMAHILGLERLFALKGLLITGSDTLLYRVLLDSCHPLMIIAAFSPKAIINGQT